MANNNLEIESKFYVTNLLEIEQLLKKIGAVCMVRRRFEFNLRFDDQKNNFRKQHKVLRLRSYDDNRLTFKDAGNVIGNTLSRTEIEIVVNDFENAKLFLKSLGFHIASTYEKYRAMYRYNSAIIALDELPYGNFVEIEGQDEIQISEVARLLGLNPEAAVTNSYQGLFEKIKTEMRLPFEHLTFQNFEKIIITHTNLGVAIANQ